MKSAIVVANVKAEWLAHAGAAMKLEGFSIVWPVWCSASFDAWHTRNKESSMLRPHGKLSSRFPPQRLRRSPPLAELVIKQTGAGLLMLAPVCI
jgi:hypothetical protein